MRRRFCFSIPGLFSPSRRQKTNWTRGLFLEIPEKPFVKLQPAYSVKLVFSYVVKGIQIKRTVKFRASRRLRFEDTKRIMSPEMLPKSYGTFEKRARGAADHTPRPDVSLPKLN